MTEQVIAHKTTDGKIFEDEAQAEAHESRIVAMREVTVLLSISDAPPLNSFLRSDLTEYMIDNREEFIRALRGEIAFETVEEAAAAGVTSGTLANGDTFGDEDDHPEGGLTVIEQLDGERDSLDLSTLDPEIPFPAPGEPRADDDIPF